MFLFHPLQLRICSGIKFLVSSFLILVVYVLSFFLGHSAQSILLIFMKNLILVFFVSLVSVSLIFALSFSSFCLLWISFVFLSVLRQSLTLLIHNLSSFVYLILSVSLQVLIQLCPVAFQYIVYSLLFTSKYFPFHLRFLL